MLHSFPTRRSSDLEALFVEWLHAQYPDRAEHVLSLIRQMREGALNDPAFGSRQRGRGPFAQLLKARFTRARRIYGLNADFTLNTSLFAPPRESRQQLDLWPSEQA